MKLQTRKTGRCEMAKNSLNKNGIKARFKKSKHSTLIEFQQLGISNNLGRLSSRTVKGSIIPIEILIAFI